MSTQLPREDRTIRTATTIGLVLAGVWALVLPAPTAAETGAWTSFEGGTDAVCSDGSPVHYLERVQDPSRVVLYFEGGGACFSAETCDPQDEGSTYVATSEVTPEQMAERGGIFDASRMENPLADHSFVYVPYCTGDVHLGNRTTSYSDGITIEHRGYPNGLIALDRLVTEFPDATNVVVAGSSAGSVPTPLFAALVADAVPEAHVLTIGDGSGAYPDDPVLNAYVGSLWGSMDALPDWPEVEGVSVREWNIPGLYGYAGRHAPEVTFATFDYAYDATQAFYGELVGVRADELVTLIDEIDADIEAGGTRVASYVAPGDAHTILGDDAFYELKVEGVRVVDWVTDLVAGETPADVHCLDCR